MIPMAQNGEMQLSNHTDAMYSGWMHYIYYAYVLIRWFTHLLTYLLTYKINQFRLSLVS